ncbi:MAG TPA: hypothetical protein VIY52_10575 [Streptosporangiaceae bacterium]
MRIGVSVLPLAAAAFVVVAAGCSAAATSSSTASTVSTGSTGNTVSTGSNGSTGSTGQAGQASRSASPGHNTPQQAAAGVIHAELSGHWSQVCNYLSPSQRPSCVSLKLSSSSTVKGEINVVGAVISGDLALVKVTGRMCFTRNGCFSNAAPSAGMPTLSETFKQAYDNALNAVGLSPVPCIKINGKWYVNSTSE